MNNYFFETEWSFDENEGRWTKYDERYNLEWMIDENPHLLAEHVKSCFAHIRYIDVLIHTAWEKIHSLPVSKEEKDKTKWSLTGLLVDPKKIDTIAAVFHETEFDIYRETHLVFILKNGSYEHVNLYYEQI